MLPCTTCPGNIEVWKFPFEKDGGAVSDIRYFDGYHMAVESINRYEEGLPFCVGDIPLKLPVSATRGRLL